MNQLDELLSKTAQVDDITPAVLQNGHAALNSAIASRSATQSSAAGLLHRRAQRSRRSRRGVIMAASVAAAAAVTAGTLVAVAPGGAGSSGNSGLQPAGGVTSSAGASLTAVVVLHATAKAAGQQQGGWPDAAYWHVTSVYETDSKIHHREVWISHHDRSVIEDNGVFGNMTPNLGFGGFRVGETNLTWNQLYALPTNPAKLKPVLLSDIKGTNPSGAEGLFVAVGDLLQETPAPPALREALYDVVAGIPGVQLAGHHKDALGRTGTAVERDDDTLLIDPHNGQLLAEIDGNPRSGLPCGKDCTLYGAAYTYTSQGPAVSAPALP